MAKQKNRVNLTLSNEMFATLAELSELTGTPKAALVNELLQDVKEHLDKSIELIKLVKKEQLTMTEVRSFYINMVADAQDTASNALREISKPTDKEIRETEERKRKEKDQNVTDNGASD